MHPDVLEEKKGTCHICGMPLEAVRLVTLYTCPVHAVIEQPKPGRCRICARDLVQMTAALTFTCAGHREVNQIEPGKCPDGSTMVARYAQRPHGDHNPKHGGIFFMAPDSWHHLEGTYPAEGRFRVYVYNEYSKPLSLAAARKVRGRVIMKEAFDPKTGTTRELASAPLVLARNGAFFEARFERIALPATLTAKISFGSDDKESRFDFTFPALTKDPIASVASAQVTSSQVGSGLSRTATFSESTSLLDDLKARQAEVAVLVKSGVLGGIYVPALRAKDAALEVQTRHRTTAGIDQDALEGAVRQIVFAAYQLDSYGDIGDGQKVQEAFTAFSTAISALDGLVAGRR